MEMILVSACLLGRKVRYDGAAKPVNAALMDRWRTEGRIVPFCPEVSGGLPVPRPAAELDGAAGAVLEGEARVRTEAGADVTGAFVRGARLALEAAERAGARMAILKEGSPSCGTHRVYDGTFSGTSRPGAGVTTTVLERAGIRVFSENELPEAADYLAALEGHS
ncbi:DUF523 domain-containing protein [Actinomadura viridis]|uniref:Uncharacterized protein YbbK (DUF523 family) n=1 Tax=Actinomadura viridis TaxID=58110 RepID=A0A931GSZ4_9ACTN|nr:DUF523 domain-containing protein [Actinomadura viridis]MBG6091399.1 uncharacterized protein YbbK (DUF523 family) [Actinomadura viridis]